MQRGADNEVRHLKIMDFWNIEMKLYLAFFLRKIKPIDFEVKLMRGLEKTKSNNIARYLST